MTVNLEVSNKPKPDGTLALFFRVTLNRKNKRIDSGYAIPKHHWKKRKGQKRYYLSKSASNYTKIQNTLNNLESTLKGMLNQNPLISIEQLISDYLNNRSSTTTKLGFFEYAIDWCYQLKNEKRMSYHKKAHNVISNFASFMFNEKLKLVDFTSGRIESDYPFESITVKTLNDFEHWLKAKDLHTNTIYINLKTLRTIYYKAESEDLFSVKLNPFKRKKLVQARTEKKALTMDEIMAIEKCELNNSNLALARDLFLFSFYCAGIRWGDVCTLTWKNIDRQTIKFIPRKTIGTNGSTKVLSLHPKAIQILEKYKIMDSNRNRVFPVIKGELDAYELSNQISSRNALVNARLKEIARIAKVKKKVSFHMARHSYATLAIQKNAPLQAISQLLGHSDLKTTQVYLKELDNDITNATHLSILNY